ncbi:MAG: pyruvate dehydrogenase component alpha subunit [Mycobacteriales bacterium]|jgi:pyruvate dehydrogenase E1 component alpha subunit
MLRILAPDGELVAEPPATVDTRALYRAMTVARVFDRRGSALQRQGRLATYAPFEGQEAAQIGSVAALRPDDWLVATYRDAAAMWSQGYPMELLIAGRTGHEGGGAPPESVNVLPPSITVGAHMLHAVGLAWAERYRRSDRVALTMFGDGATSEGDFHEAMNFAGVYRVGCVFLCQNNGWAISLPTERQTAAATLADKAIGYGMPGVRVDGNDVLAVYEATEAAVLRARGGDGPTLIEAVTYRVGPHTTADDPGRYRAEEQTEAWRQRDPIDRLRRYLAGRGEWSRPWQDELEREAAGLVDAAVTAAEALPAFTAGEIFDATFAELPPLLAEQRGWATGAADPAGPA